MSRDKEIDSFINIFNLLKEERANKKNHGCDDMFCSTCGGYGHYVMTNLSIGDKNKLQNFVSEITEDEYIKFKNWQSVLDLLFPDKIKPVADGVKKKFQERRFKQIGEEIDLVDISDIRSVERYIFYNRRNYEYYENGDIHNWWYLGIKPLFKSMYSMIDEEEKKKYQKKYSALLELVIAEAIETGDYSMVESLAIILKKRLYLYPNLLKHCLHQCPDGLIMGCLGIMRKQVWEKLETEK